MHILILSDLHLGKGRFLRNGQVNLLEDFYEDEKFFEKLKLDKLTSIDDSLIFSLNLISQKIKAKLILVISLSGYSGRIISRFRPKIPLFVFTCGKKISRQLNLHWGLFH